MKLVPEWLTKPRSTLRGWLVGIGLGWPAFATLIAFPAFFTAHAWVLLILFSIASWVGCVAYEHPNPVTGMRNIARLPDSTSRGWFVGVGIFALEARAGGSALDALLKAHEWLSFGLIPIPWWIGHRAYQHPNPLPAILRDVRELLPSRRVIAKALLALAISFYGTFVLLNLWNWFAVPALNVPPISYWLMFGLNMLLGTLIDRESDTLFPILVQHASLPEEKRREIEETLTNERLWTVAGPLLFNRLFTLTATLAIGWAINVFLM